MIRITQVIFFCLLLMFLGFCGGMFLGSFVVPAGSGLAGPTITFGYGLAGFAVGLIAAVILTRILKHSQLRNALIIAGILSLIMCGWIFYRIKLISNKQAKVERSNYNLHADAFYENDNQLPVGAGIAKPHLIPGRPLYFYSYIPFGAETDQLKPMDSITFSKGEHFVDIATAPPWLVPEFLKLDYDLFFLRTLTLSKEWLEVIVNNKTGQTAWIDANAADFTDWQKFLLDVTAVEVIEPTANPVRLKPLNHAAILAEPPRHFEMRPLAINGDWIMVSTLGLADRIPPTGWIRWRNGNLLLIRYSPLS